MEPDLHKGKLKKWKHDRGFGFIRPVKGGQEVFLHISELKGVIRRPRVSDTVYYYPVIAPDGRVRACNAFILKAESKPISSYGALRNKATSNPTFASLFLGLEVFLLSILPLVGSIHFARTTTNPLPLILYPVMSLLTFALYADDKSRAQREEWRTPEKTLHLCELAGGWLGGFIAQRRLHHKSRKESYQAIFWAIVMIHHIAWLGWLFFGKSISR